MSKTKIILILQWLKPKNIKQLSEFSALTGYYRRFIKHFTAIVEPLTNLLKKDVFHWLMKVTDAFK